MHQTSQGLKCLYSNVDSLLNKRHELLALVNYHKPHIIGITELKPKNCRYGVQDCEIAIDGYQLFHNLDSQGRGIGLYIEESLKPAQCSLFDNYMFNEKLFVECNLKDNDKLLLGLFYRSPNSLPNNNTDLNNLFREIGKNNEHSHVLLIGDFNYRDIDWTNELCNTEQETDANRFLEATRDAFLIQHQTTPTRHRIDQTPSLLDLVFTNEEGMIEDIETCAGIGKSDHATLIINFKCYQQENTTSEQIRYMYDKGDYESMRNAIRNTDWKSELTGLSVENAWTKIKSTIQENIDRYIPTKKVNQNTSHSHKKKWMDSHTMATIRKKHKLYRRWLETQQGKDYQEFAKARNQAKWACRKAVRMLEKKIADQAKHNPKAFWSYVQSKLKTRSGVSDLDMPDGTRTSTDNQKADVLNEFFQSVFTKENMENVPPPPVYDYGIPLINFNFSESDVLKLLQKLKTGKAAGPDGLHPQILKELADVIAGPLYIFFQLSLANQEVPEEWKEAYVSPVFKKGSRHTASNYRPISLTSIVCKLMETLVRNHIVSFIQEKKLFCNEQHGFIKGRSCVTHLLEVLETWTKVLDTGGSIDVIYTDFMKAFDKVPHQRLLQKIAAHGIQGNVLGWIASFLKDRRQCVVVNGSKSSWADVTSGIPQGSVLGPILFILFINDLPQVVNCGIKIFADDTKIYTRSDLPDAPAALQTDLDKIQQWADDWQLRFHPDKCVVMKLGKKKSDHCYHMKSVNSKGEQQTHNLKVSHVEKDLGVYVDDQLAYKQHIGQAIAKATRTLGCIRRSFEHLDEATLICLYKGLIRPSLEYGQSVWSPHQIGLTKQLEAVQRRATKLIPGLKDLAYPERLRHLKLPTLELRRQRGDMIDVFKYLHKFYDVSEPLFRTLPDTGTRGNSLKLFKTFSRLELRKQFFSNRVVSSWNLLPDNVVTSESVNMFKNRLDLHWKSHHLLYHPTNL